MTADAVLDPEATYYLSGPMTGLPEYNYPYFAKVAARLRYFDLEVQSPHENEWPKCIDPSKCDPYNKQCDFCNPETHEQYKWQFMMDAAMRQMNQCDAIVLLRGWPKSRGARAELSVALDRNWQVYYYLDPPGRLLNMVRIP